jgi:hypothetical protein
MCCEINSTSLKGVEGVPSATQLPFSVQKDMYRHDLLFRNKLNLSSYKKPGMKQTKQNKQQ